MLRPDDRVRPQPVLALGELLMGFTSPFDLIGIGLMSSEEARELHAVETAGPAGSAA